jgi:predicted component of type VI protein secretion system
MKYLDSAGAANRLFKQSEASRMGVVMVMFRADGQRRNFSVTRDMTVIGRREDCDLRIPLSDVSRKHCRVIVDGDSLKVEDLGSSNGTYVNGERVQQAELSPGDTLQIGPVVFVLQVDGHPADEELQPVTAQSAGAAGNAGTRTGEPASAEDVVDLETTSAGGDSGSEDFDPMEALESAEGSAFDFQIDESAHGEESPQANDESPVDLEESGH